MSIQILGLRDHFDQKSGVTKKYETFFKNNWRAPSVPELFKNLDKYIEPIPKAERENLYYTAAQCFEEPGRKLKEQWVIPFDVDDIDVTKVSEVVDVVCNVLKVSKSEVGVVFSGNGVQVIVGLEKPITDDGFFDKNRDHYRAICDKITDELKKKNLPGEGDPSVFSKARLLRLPKTLNKKPDKETREAKLINALIKALDFSLPKISMLPDIAKEDQISQLVLDKYPIPDTQTVLSECEFLKWTKKEPKKVSEPQWYGMLSVIAKLPDGRKTAHEYSKGHPNYTPHETETKIDQAIKASGPRTCKNIDALWGQCKTCKHFQTELVSPIMIQGPNYIKTATTGFYTTKIDAQGSPRPHKPCYDDLRKFFEQRNPYITRDESEIIYTFNGKCWQEFADSRIKEFAQKNFNPKADNKMRSEFLGLLRSTKLRDPDWFDISASRKMNFNNGVLDLDSMTVLPHSREYGFRYVLPYDYDPKATAPRFEQFMREITLDRKELIDVLLEFAGYAFSNDECWTQKALLMYGDGANGKSTLMDVFRALAGAKNYSSLTVSDLKSDVHRFELDGKLFNLAEETPNAALLDSSLFRNLTTGGECMIKMLYHQPMRISNRAKLMFACNELPKTNDSTSALLRRLIIVPFDAMFSEGSKDPFIVKKLRAELPGIFNMIIGGYQRLREQGKFTDSKIVEAEIAKYKDDIDDIFIFVRDVLEVLPLEDSNFTSLDRIYEEYAEFSKSRGEKGLTYQTFVRRLSRMIPKYDKRKTKQQENRERKSGLLGIKFQDNSVGI